MSFRISLFCILLLAACTSEKNYTFDSSQTEGLHQAMKVLTDVMVSDVFSPPVASRNYVYSAIAAYEAIVPAFEDYISLAGQLNGLELPPQPNPELTYDWEVVATAATLSVGKELTFDRALFKRLSEPVLEMLQERDIPTAVFQRSIEHGEKVGKHILEWASRDYYKELRTYPKYTPSDKPQSWVSTPPAYFDAIEPSWRKMRLLVQDSARQFSPNYPTHFSTDRESQFYKEAYAVYTALDEGDEAEKREIAGFWDCNPFAMEAIGHLMVGAKKISPGGHWMNIASLASRLAGADIMKSAEALALTSIALYEGFISCWDEKYRSNLLRPETFINRYIDETWVPALQSPPFPEHTSGHSVISTAAALALTRVFGDNFAFDDTTQLEFDLPVRSFNSFIEASEEAAISRFYGGIHYMPAITYGVEQGRNIGKLVNERVQTRAVAE
ncbi:MAG: phosphatase PAP2 family protein [Saprospirales bacterium]|nr:MAG: phosphatase PAP2 family protein [Saprospirales bacterium]